MWLWRLRRNDKEFPKPDVVINGRPYWQWGKILDYDTLRAFKPTDAENDKS
jgi:hypothetical protein